MQISRRGFLSISAGSAMFAVGGCRSFFTGARADYDPNLTVFFADVHVRGGSSYQKDHFRDTVAKVLKMDPLPKNVVIFGDFAYHSGLKKDYEESAPFIKQLADAGINVTIGMGNHDRRSTFAEVYPQYAKTTKVPGRFVNIVDIGHADLLMLDSLAGSDNRKAHDMGPVAGSLNKAQQDWLLKELPKRKRPFFICAHHPLHELSVAGKNLKYHLADLPMVAGYIYGHNHRWYKQWQTYSWGSRSLLRTLCLPSTGHWGDIGYVTFRTSPGRAVASLAQNDFFFPSPLKDGEKRPEIWNSIVRENLGQQCEFLFGKA